MGLFVTLLANKKEGEIMQNISSSFWKIFILATALTLLSVSAQALDAPHNVSFATGCLSCHDMTSNAPNLIPTDTFTPDPLDIDHTLNNSVCEKCHIDGPDGTAPYMPTHSSQQTDESYGQWTVECRVCHNQHSQDQFKNYGTASYVYTGTNGGVNNAGADAIITVTGPAMTPDQYAGYIVVPNTARLNYNYKIIGNTVDTLTVEGLVNTTYAVTGSQLAISYGKFIRSSINLANIGKTGSKAVRFFKPTGPNSFADGDPANIDGICEVCHTLTSHWRNDGSFAAVGVHDGLQATNCMSCHPHSEGFKADCGACHGFPPEDGATLVASPGPTGSATAGAHIEHTTNQAIGCDACHYKNFPDGEHNNGAPLSVTIGFGPNPPIPQGGSYDGQALVPYDRTTTTPETTVSNTGSKTCSALYCHGNYAGSGLNASPVWDNPATGDCGTCHLASNVADNSPKSGSHEKHADVDQTIAGGGSATFNRGYKCTLCHTGLVEGAGPTYTLPADKSKHVNGLVEWAFDATDARVAGSSYGTAAGTRGPTDGIAPNQAYSSCSNVYCHSIVQTGTGGALTANSADYKTPVWSGTATCGSCHNQDGSHFVGTVMNSGSHTAHLAYPFTTVRTYMKCELCHRMGTSAVSISGDDCSTCHANGEKTKHVDGNVDVVFETDYVGNTAAYSGTPTPGDGYATCASTYCHGSYAPSGLNATPTWGTPANGACGTCHGASNTTPPTDSAATSSTSHRWHAATGNTDTQSASGYNLNCGTCHNSVVDGSGPASYTIASKTLHVNKAVDWQFDTTDARVSAGSAYSVASASQPPSDGVFRAYGSCSMVYCHSNGQADGGGAPDYKTPQWGVNYSCGDAVTGCHPVDPSHNSTGPRMSSGSHSAHLAYTFNLTSNRRQCTTCHKWNLSAPFNSGCSACHSSTTAHTARNTYHVNKEVDLRFETAFTGAASIYNGTPAPGDGYANCSTTYCHGDGTSVSTGTISANTTPDWGSGPLTCASCHSNGPAYANGSPKANNHPQHIAAGITCDKCHYDTTTDGTTIASKANHVNRAYNVTPNSGAGISFAYTFSATGGSCATNGCHIDAIWGHTHNVQYNAAVDTSQPSVQGCADCHNDSGGSLATWADIMAEHDVATNGAGSCATCHNSARNTGVQPPFTSVADVIDSSTATVTCTVCHDDKTPNVEHGYLPHDDAPNRTVATWTGASGAGTDPDCKVCHDDGSVSGEVVYSTTTHGGDCILCHASIPNPLQGTTALATAMPTGTALFNDGGGSCIACHTNSYTVHTVNSADQAASLHDKVSLTYAAINGCDACHGGAGSLDTWLEIIALHNNDCASCHNSDITDVVATIQAGRSNANGFTGGNTAVDCDSCHITDTDAGVSFNVDAAVTPMGHGLSAATVRGEHNMFSTSGIAGITDCANCHDMGTTDVVADFQKRIELHTSPNNPDHAGSCLTCHVGKGDPANAQIAAGIGGTAVNCNGCHTAKGQYLLHGLTSAAVVDVHEYFNSSIQTAEKNCANCHVMTTVAQRLDLHPACTTCHTSATPAEPAVTTIANGWRDVAPGPVTANCESCHTAKGVYKLHGLTDDNSVADGIGDGTGGVVYHDNLGNSTGLTVTYSGKLSGAYGGLKVSSYNCGDCHAADPNTKAISALEAMQLHTLVNGSGSGDCLTCHGFAAAADEIAAGIGGAVQYCENCHAAANGNGPSGEAMYQYDGVRHHKTGHAQAGDCTWCHADPRPSTTTQAGAYAATADTVGTYDTGWINDYSVGYAGTIPKQPACRLCHTNYGTDGAGTAYSVNVSGGSGNHGYNLTGTATQRTTGLTVWANDYYARHATLNSATSITADPVTQTQIHRIDANDGSSMIKVYDYGACLGCHSVQVMHAAPIPTTDYQNGTACNNAAPWDTLRYAPGRSLFNFFRGTAGGTKTWSNHRYSSTSTQPYDPCSNGNQRTRAKDTYKNIGTWNWGSVANTLLNIPTVSPFSNHEGLSGMGATYAIPMFTDIATPAIPDDVQFISASWDGSTVTVQATNDDGCAALSARTQPDGVARIVAGGFTGTNLCTGTFVLGSITGVTLDIETTNAAGTDSTGNVITDDSGPVAASAVNDAFGALPSVGMVLDVLANDSGTDLQIVVATVSSVTRTGGAGTCGTLSPNTANITYNGGTGTADCEFTYETQAYDGATPFGAASQATVTVNQTANAAPTLSISEPSGQTGQALASPVAITYSLADTDNVVTASFSLDSDTNAGNGTGSAIICTGGTGAGAEGSNVTCTWNGSAIATGGNTYYVYGVTDDGVNPAVGAYSGSITFAATPPFTDTTDNFTGVTDGTRPSSTPAGWSTYGSLKNCWNYETGTSTASTGTGAQPSGVGSASPWIYRESSGTVGTPNCGTYAVGEEWYIESPNLDAALYSFTLSFDSGYEGTGTFDTVEVQYRNGSGGAWTTKATLNYAAHGTTWYAFGPYDFSGDINQAQSRIRIKVTAGSSDADYDHDVGFDTIHLNGTP